MRKLRDSTTARRAISVPEMATQIGVSRGFGYALVRNGDIPSIRLGKRILVPCEAIDRILRGNRRGQGRDRV